MSSPVAHRIPNRDAVEILRAAYLSGKNRNNPDAVFVDTTRGEDYVIVDIPLSKINMENPQDGIVDSTVDTDRAKAEMANLADLPPIHVGANFRKTNRVSVLDGGHRVYIAKLRGEKTVSAMMKASQWGMAQKVLFGESNRHSRKTNHSYPTFP